MFLRTRFRQSRENLYLRKFCLIIISLALVSIQMQAQNGWTKKADMLTPRVGASASVVNNKIYVIGGMTYGYTDLAVNEVYDPLTDTWETKQPMQTARSYLLTCVVNDTIYAIGGGYPTATKKTEAYDPVTNTWTTKKDMPYPWFSAIGGTVNGKIYVMGGNYNQRNCLEYDPSSNEWEEKTSVPRCAGALSATVYNGLVYTFGGTTSYPFYGTNNPSEPLSTVDVYNPQTNTWDTTKMDMPTPRYNLRTFLVNEKIYAIGGTQARGTTLSTIEVYNLLSDTWESKPNMPENLAWFADAVVNDKIYVIGGSPDWVTGTGNVWEYVDPTIPVELSSFAAISKGKEVTLNWSTATELNNQGFEVQRKFGSNDFVTVGSVRGHGTTTYPNNYTYADKLTDAGKYFYRLKQIDFGGKYEYSQTVEVIWSPSTTCKLEQNFSNPFNPTTTIGFGIPEKGNVRLSVLNILGEEIKVLLNEEKEAGYHSIKFNGSNLTSGIYFYRIQSGNFIDTKKMLLLK